MDVSSVSKPVSLPAAAKPVVSEQHNQESKPAAKPPEPEKVREVQSKPVINTQGHVTGRHINVSA
jgi:hypothetical protein